MRHCICIDKIRIIETSPEWNTRSFGCELASQARNSNGYEVKSCIASRLKKKFQRSFEFWWSTAGIDLETNESGDTIRFECVAVRCDLENDAMFFGVDDRARSARVALRGR